MGADIRQRYADGDDNTTDVIRNIDTGAGSPALSGTIIIFGGICDSAGDEVLLATSTLQTAGNASLTSIDGKITACNTGAVVVSSSALPSGAATQTTLAAILSAIGNVFVSTVDGDAIRINGMVTAAQSGTWNITNVSGTVSLPTGASTLAEQQSQTTQLTRLAGKYVDYDTAAGTDSVVAFGLLLPSAGGAVIGGTSTNPIRIDPTGSTTQPVSGTITANAGTNLNTSALALESGGNLAALAAVDFATGTDVASLAVVGNGVAATAQRVTIASDSTGVIGATQSGDWSVRLQDGGGNAITSAVRGSERAMSVQIVDGSGNQITSFGGGSGGTSSTDDQAFTAGSGSGTPAMGFFSADTVDAGDVGVLAMDASRRLLVSLEVDNAGIASTLSTIDADTSTLAGAVAGTEMQVDVIDFPALPTGDNVIGRVKISDGTDVADVLDLSNSNPLTVAVVDGSGDQITSFGGGTQYSEGATAGTITGTAMLMEGAGDALVPAQGTVADGLLVNLGGNNDVTVTGTVDVTGSSVTATVSGTADVSGSTVAATQSGTWTVDAVQSGSWAVYAAQSGTWSVDQSGTWNINDITTVCGQTLTFGAGAVDAGTLRITHASDDPVTASLNVIDDWDESDRAKVNLIVGQAGITAGAGAVAANTPRVTHASDDPAVAKLTDIETNTDSGAVVGNGAAATAQRVTLANDSTGVLATVTTVTTVSTLTGGGVAHDSADSGNPVKVGGKAAATLSDDTMVADADRANFVADLDGAQLMRIGFPLGDLISERVTNTDGSSTAFSNFGATASTRSYITAISAFNSSATTGYIDFRDGTSGSVLYTVAIPAGGGVVISAGGTPLFRTSANTALAYDVSAALSTVYISVSGFKSKV